MESKTMNQEDAENEYKMKIATERMRFKREMVEVENRHIMNVLEIKQNLREKTLKARALKASLEIQNNENNIINK